MTHDSRFPRRAFLKAGVGVVGGLALPGAVRVPTALADPNVRTAGQWLPSHENPLIRRFSFENNTAETISFVTLMRVSNKGVSNRRADWYMWHWTHPAQTKIGDTKVAGATSPDDVCRLYGASTPWRGWRELGVCSFPNPGGSFDPNHLEAGDVVWNGDHFLCSPHSLNLSTYRQNTFLYRSTDGQNWTLVGGPILPHGTSDAVHIGYGRFLRDMYGNLAWMNGRAYWYYNGRYANNTPIGFCALHLASSANPSSATSWSKSANSPIKNPLGGGYFELGSALLSNGYVWLFSSVGQPGQLYHDRAKYAYGPNWFNSGMGTPFFSNGSFMGGPSYIADNRHYMVYPTLMPPTVPAAGGRFEIDLLYTQP